MAGEAGMAQRLQKTVQQFLIRLKIHLNDLPAILCLGIDRRENRRPRRTVQACEWQHYSQGPKDGTSIGGLCKIDKQMDS